MEFMRHMLRAGAGRAGVMKVFGRLNQHPLRRIALWAALPISGGIWGYSQYLKSEELSPVANTQGAESLQSQLVEQSLDTPKLSSNTHTAKWRVYTDRGKDLFSQGRLNEAEKYFLEAIEEAKKGFGDEDPHVASSSNNLAELYRMRKEFEKAEPLYLQAVHQLEHTMGPEHPSVGFALHNLGGFYLLQNKLDKATECYERALKIKGRGLGLNHPEYASTMFHLGKVKQLLGKLEEAETYIRQSIQILEDGGFSQCQGAIRKMVTLAEILVQSNQLQEAEKLQRKIVQSLEVSQGPEASSTIIATENLANTLQLQGNFNEAEELFKRCLEIRQKVYSSDHMQIWAVLFKLTCIAMDRAERLAADNAQSHAMAEYDKAETLLQQAIRIAEENWNQALTSGALLDREAHTRSIHMPYLLALVQSLNTLGLLGIRRLEVAGPHMVMDEGVGLAEKGLRQCLLLLKKDGVLGLASSGLTDVVKEQLKCTERLAMLLSKLHCNNKEIPAEVRQLRNEASFLKSRVNL